MKAIKTIVIFSTLTLFTACDKSGFLAYDHYDGPITEDQFWNIDVAARGQVNRAYTFLPVGYTKFDGALLAAGCDEAVNSDLNASINVFNNGTWGPLRTLDDAYKRNYDGIRQANVFLENAHRANIEPASDIPRIRGEALFLRAFYHFELMKRYGGIVIATRVFNTDDDLDLPRNSFEETVTQIVADCEAAAALLPLSPTHYGAGDRGRATAAAAMALKARTLLYAASPLYNRQNDAAHWHRAAAAARELIDLDVHGLHNSYATLFNFTAAAYNTEIIFATAPTARNDIEMNNAPISYNGALGRTNPTQELVDTYEMTSGLLPDQPGSGFNPEAPYANRDPRFIASIFFNGTTFKQQPVLTHIGGKDGPGQSINATKTGYYMRKFTTQDATWNQASNALIRRPWVLLRFAEVLLNYAEAQNEAEGPDPSVYDAINRVRARAGVNMPPLPAGLSQEGMRERIRRERRIELSFEEHRFFDVRRWMEGPETLGGPVSGMRITPRDGGFDYERFVVETRVFDERMYLFPIPQSEINNTTNLEQNPGY